MVDGHSITPCFECGNPAHFNHHVIPLSIGGTKTVPLCATCHGKVHNRTFTMDHRELIKRGIAAAKARGVRYEGRQPKFTEGERAALRTIAALELYSVSRICRAWGISRSTFYRLMPPRPVPRLKFHIPYTLVTQAP